MKIEKKHDGYGGCLLYIIIIAVVAVLLSCTKQQIQENKYVFDRYEMVIDWYTLDTSRLLKLPHAYVQVFDSIYKDETRMAFDTCSDRWYIDCNMLDVQQHLYYKKNGKKIQPSSYPKN